MKLAIILFSLFAVAVLADERPAQVKGRGLILDSNDADAVASMNDVLTAARNLVITRQRRLVSSLDKMNVMIQNIDCGACMESPGATRKLLKLRGSTDRELSTFYNDVFVTALNCDAANPFQIWNLLSLEPTGYWYTIESAQTGQCVQLFGDCNPDGTLYDIEMGPCDVANTKTYWGLTGIGEIVSYKCLRNNWEQNDLLYHSTPDIFLEATCSNTGGKDYLDLSSHSEDSKDMAENYWVIYPMTFGI